jgi:hypothetical protein
VDNEVCSLVKDDESGKKEMTHKHLEKNMDKETKSGVS